MGLVGWGVGSWSAKSPFNFCFCRSGHVQPVIFSSSLSVGCFFLWGFWVMNYSLQRFDFSVWVGVYVVVEILISVPGS